MLRMTMSWENDGLKILDQTKLPNAVEFIFCSQWEQVAEAIKKLAVRGAPAIGVAAAYGMALGVKNLKKEKDFLKKIVDIAEALKATRPTAVNLFWAIDKMLFLLKQNQERNIDEIHEIFLQEAMKMEEDDVAINEQMGEYGAKLFDKPVSILTHCNAGALATVAWGTALGVIRKAHLQGKIKRVFADETRPLLQGARLTVWEMMQDQIPVTLITDNMAGWVMKKGMVDAVITGADRIAMNGDTANKIGTYSVAVLAKENNIPFFIAAPISTFDFNTLHGDKIIIEERKAEEVASLFGVNTAPLGVEVFNPSFDVTPNKYITAIITEFGVIKAPFEENIANLRNKIFDC